MEGEIVVIKKVQSGGKKPPAYAPSVDTWEGVLKSGAKVIVKASTAEKAFFRIERAGREPVMSVRRVGAFTHHIFEQE